MIKRFPYLLSGLLFAGIFIASVAPKGDVAEPEKEALILQTVLSNLGRYHFEPANIDDQFSEEAFDLYLNDLDRSRLFFTAEEVAALYVHHDQLDDQMASGSFTFFNETQDLVLSSRARAQAWYREILSQPFDLEKGTAVSLRSETDEWLTEEASLRQYWEDYLKRDLLRKLINKQKELEKKAEKAAESGETANTPTLAELEEEIRAETLTTFDKWFDRMAKISRSQALSQYINAITSVFDPHTSYLRPKDKENFDIRFSGRLEGIGATLQTSDDYTQVSSIVVGGPAWKGKELQDEDVIMAVRQEEGEAVDIKGMELDDVVSQIRGPKGTKVHLTVKKKTGEISEITIERDVVVIDESFARSLILDGVEGEKVGYLYLPSFYADFQHEDGRFCSKDVEIELQKLKDAGVAGIILDLRNNGGGSLTDVVKMTGFFIPEGPIVQVKDRINQVEVLQDKDDRVQYDGPLIVMVNQYSASASEILAAALQDYDRALIVGSNSTFGKGTVQRFIDLDRTIRGHEEAKPLGTVKLTMQKFYRINGGSTQLKGVVPDIILPDTYANLETGEKKETNPMAWTQIAPVPYEQNVFRLGKKEKLARNSEKRIAQNPTFDLIRENAKRFKELSDRNTFPLSLSAYRAAEEAIEKEAEKYQLMFEAPVNQGVKNLEIDLPSIEADESKQARNEEFIKDVSRDVYLQETLHILRDMINQQ